MVRTVAWWMVERNPVRDDAEELSGLRNKTADTTSGGGLDGDWPWWLGGLPSGHNHGNERLSKMAIPHMTRNGKPSTCPALIHAALSELTMPTIVHKVVSEPDFDHYDRSNVRTPPCFVIQERVAAQPFAHGRQLAQVCIGYQRRVLWPEG
eukprot:849578-Prorocentrum_minimum.AAC.1